MNHLFALGLNDLFINSAFKSRLCYFILLVLVSGQSVAQDPEFEWAKRIGGTGEDRGFAIAVDPDSNILTAGIFFLTADFDPGPNVFNLTALGNKDIFVSKLDALGNFVWAKQIGGTLADDANSLDVDSEGNVYVTGVFRSIVDFDPGPAVFNLTAGGPYAAFVLKLNAQGEFIWAKRFGGSGFSEAHGFSIGVDNFGNVHTCGRFTGTVDFNPGTGTFNMMYGSGGGIFVSKLNSSGDLVWAKQMGGQDHLDAAFSIGVDDMGNVYTTGEFWGACDFNPGPAVFTLTSVGANDMFVSKLSDVGSFVWAKKIGADGLISTTGRSLALDESGNVSATGKFSGTADFDPGPAVYNLTSSGSGDIFVLKLNNAGEFEWAKRIGGAGSQDDGKFVFSDRDGNVYATGVFDGLNVDFDPGPGSFLLTGFIQVFVLKFDISGDFVWAIKMGANSSTAPSVGFSITRDDLGKVYTTGSFNGTSDFDPGPSVYNLISAGGPDVFFSKLQEDCLTAGMDITTQPISQVSNTCDQATFQVRVQGVPPSVYTWYKNDVLIPGATASTYTTPVLSMTDNGSEYHCVVSNCTGMFIETSDVATLTVLPCVSSLPNISLSESVLDPDDSLVVTGIDFTPDGLVELTIRNEFGDIVGDSIPITYIDPGMFSYTLPITIEFLEGMYTIMARDSNSGKHAPQKSFRVFNPVLSTLFIRSPTSSSIVPRAKTFDITWTDFVIKNPSTGQTGSITKTYRVEISTNAGNSWSLIKDHSDKAHSGRLNTFSIQYSVTEASSMILRVSDLGTPGNIDQTNLIFLTDCDEEEFSASLEWDATVPPIGNSPVGLSADGTARIFIKLTKDPTNTKQVSFIEANLETVGNNYSGPGLLGKIMYATNHTSYCEEANVANSTFELYSAAANGNQNAASYWFWLVAPDDYTSDPNEESSERSIQTTFTITYTDNSTKVIQPCAPIRIFRPALLFVHGILSDQSSVVGARFTTNENGTDYFSNSVEWQVAKRVNLKSIASFSDNANILLEKSADENIAYENSLKSALRQMHKLGIANKRVDYVCHSMGGSIGRTMINNGGERYKPGIIPYQNYGNGYVNKFITICTPHNGSYIADLTIDVLSTATNILGGYLLRPYKALSELWGRSGGDIINLVTPGALEDLQAHSDGVVLKETTIRNHLISADIDSSNNHAEEEVINQLFSLQVPRFLHPNNLLAVTINQLYGNPEFFYQTDGVVQLSSQLAGKPVFDAVNIKTNPAGIGNTSIIYGPDKMHAGIQKDLTVGTRVKKLLNAEVGSGYFDNSIPANSSNDNLTIGNNGSPAMRSSFSPDTIISRIDTVAVKILSPGISSVEHVDSSIDIVMHLKDTVGLQNLRVFFQSDFYISDASDSFQVFQTFVQPEYLGRNLVVALAEYDSLGYVVYHIDTASVFVTSADSLIDFQVTPEAQSVNPGEILHAEHNIFYQTFIGLLDPCADSLTHMIMDTNVVIYDSIYCQFMTKDTGSTSIIFTYGGISDTLLIYISSLIDNNLVTLCPSGSTSLFSGINDITKTYQWQVDTSGVFVDIMNNLFYSGTDSSSLVISGVPTQWYNYRYRCIISDPIGATISEVFTLRFRQSWSGAVNTNWENPGNWSCSSVPDAFTDVLVNTGLTNYPVVNSSAVCRKLSVRPGASVLVNPGFELTVTGQE